jgi:hypothetical protein
MIDEGLKWNENNELLCSKANRRLYFLMKLRDCEVDRTILRLFYDTVILSVLSYAMICWYGNQAANLQYFMNRIDKRATRTIGDGHVCSWNNVFKLKAIAMYKRIMNNANHPLRHMFVALPSGKRMRSIRTRTTRHKDSFMPKIVRIINESDSNTRNDLIALTHPK